jgi:hypothetical protein
MMVDAMDRRRMVMGHGTKGRQHETLDNPTILANVGWQTFPNLAHTPYH